MLKKQYFFVVLMLAFATASNVAALFGGFSGSKKSKYEEAYEQLKVDIADSADEFCKSYQTLGDSIASVWNTAITSLEKKAADVSAKAQQGAAKLQGQVQERLKCAHGTMSTTCAAARDTITQAYAQSINWLTAQDAKDKKTVVAAGRISAVLAGAVVVGAVLAAAKKLLGKKEKKAAADKRSGYEPAPEPIVMQLDKAQDEVGAVYYEDLFSLDPQDDDRDWDAYSIVSAPASDCSEYYCDCCPGGVQIEGTQILPVPSAPPYYMVEGQ